MLAAAISHGARAGRDVQAALHRMSRLCGLRLEAEGAEAAVISGWNQPRERALPERVDAATPDTPSHALPSPGAWKYRRCKRTGNILKKRQVDVVAYLK